MVGRMLGPPIVQFVVTLSGHRRPKLRSRNYPSITLVPKDVACLLQSIEPLALRGGRPTRSLPREDIRGNQSANCATRPRPIPLARAER